MECSDTFTKQSFSDSQHYPECVCKLLLSCDFFVCLDLPGSLPVVVLYYFIFINNIIDYSCFDEYVFTIKKGFCLFGGKHSFLLIRLSVFI